MKSKIQTSNITINYYSMPWATVLMYLLFGNIYLVSIQYFHQQLASIWKESNFILC